MITYVRSTTRLLAAIALLVAALGSAAAPRLPHVDSSSRAAYIVQASSEAAAAAAVAQAGGKVMLSLPIINGVAARLDPQALRRLRAHPGLLLHADAAVHSAGNLSALEQAEAGTDAYLLYPSAATGSTVLHQQPYLTRTSTCSSSGVTSSNVQQLRKLQGWGVTVAVIDSGFMEMKDKKSWQAAADGTLFAKNAEGRCIVYRDFLPRTPANGNVANSIKDYNSVDQSGHGTHVISTIADSRPAVLKRDGLGLPAPVGVAPKVNLLLARALDKDGAGSYSDVINAIQWVIANQARYNVRVLNLSLYAPVEGPYWADPLAQAVMRAWQAGIVVVVAAGNLGPDAGSITVPGNVPYVITVGAIKSGRYTTSGSDELAYYSSRGPTESAFVKPDVLVPASRTIAPMPDDSTLALQLSQECSRKAAAGSLQPCIETKADVNYGIGKPLKKHTYFYLSGTSMAAAEVSGIVALVLQANPNLTNDAVKYRLLATARPALDITTGQGAYSLWEQGAGLVDTQQAVLAATIGIANEGMDIGLDLTSNTHYSGYTTWNDPLGEFQLVDPTTGQLLAVWDGVSKLWGGASKLWGGASKLWGGASKLWGGGINDWTAGAALWAGTNRFWAGSTASTSLSTASRAGILVSDDDPMSTPTSPVYPIAECIVDRHNGTYTAYFGYQNDNLLPVTLLFGAGNQFSLSRPYRGQPTTFLPGRAHKAFSVDFDGSDLVWIVNGHTAMASSLLAQCAP